jgi:hypothetical protein
MLTAARAGDLAGVEQAIADRAAALAAGEVVTPEVSALGEQALEELRQMHAALRTEDARLRRLESSLGNAGTDPSVSLRG